MKTIGYIFSSLFLLSTLSCVQQLRGITIQFEVDMNEVKDVKEVGVIGEYEPLSWEIPTMLTDPDGDGIYSGEVTIMAAYNYAEFKFVLNNDNIELEGRGNRVVKFTDVTEAKYSGKYDVAN